MGETTPGQADYQQLAADVHNALVGALRRHEVSIVTKWVVLVETLDQDGTVGVWALAPVGQRSWDTKGMLTHALDIERAGTIHDTFQQLQGE